MLGAAEVVVFEADTFLVMAKSGSPLSSEVEEYDSTEKEQGLSTLDPDRFEKISEIVKRFRKTCQRTGEEFAGFETSFDGVSVVLEPMTRNTFVLVVVVDPRVGKWSRGQPNPVTGLIKYNIHAAQAHFVEVGSVTDFQRKCK